MYALKPILTEQNIDLPANIYKMSPINSVSAENTQISKNKSVSCSKNLNLSWKKHKPTFSCVLG